MGGRILVAILAVACLFLAWQNLWLRHDLRAREAPTAEASTARTTSAPASEAAPLDGPHLAARLARALPDAPTDTTSATVVDDAPLSARDVIAFFTPQAGESLVDYRDRVLPVVEGVVAPQRRRVAAARDAFFAAARVTPEQQQALAAAVDQAGESMKDRVMQAVLSGELAHPKPMTAVNLAHDLLGDVAQADQRFRAVLTPEQRTALDGSDFDVADYLLFSTRWEDLLGVESDAPR